MTTYLKHGVFSSIYKTRQGFSKNIKLIIYKKSNV